MVYLFGYRFHHRSPISLVSVTQNGATATPYDVVFLSRCCRYHRFSSASESSWEEFPVENAYELLGVLETSSFAEIKASFHKLAKETHPDLAESRNDSAESRRFVQILAAYEILSDSRKRAHYDMYLLSQRRLMQRHSQQGSKLHIYESHSNTFKEMEVVEWLKWYRLTINDILSEKKVVDGTGYFDVLERDFYSAIHAAYYGPEIDSMPMELFPECFEAEERSSQETSEVLHLVSGRDLFGMVCLVDKIPEISSTKNEKLISFRSFHSGLCQSTTKKEFHINEERQEDFGTHQTHTSNISNSVSDAYRDLELHVSGRVIATASRDLPRCYSDEGCCYVYNSNGDRTHAIMKHRTLLVKHLHWYEVGDKVSLCECRCTRARLPPSKFWLFEPRCGFHDIGGWYVETYGKDKKGHTVPSQRLWDGLDNSEQADRRLHPAMYLFALAYRTLDIEYAKANKKTFRHVVGAQMFRILHWCRKLV
ncbi:hypothetical protein PIB30_008085 [Stylosanthes scabra]|uniref:J domain-containing protein n=1 Tax=Stylosanthes scabra TaxID=79078 RepID=A0ABU6X3V5_9FABA|nr:hypothetical protein [Stylosanthes scabra]